MHAFPVDGCFTVDVCLHWKKSHFNIWIFVCVCAFVSEMIIFTRIMVYPVGKNCFCGGLSICLRGRHASKTIYTNWRWDAGHCGGADAWWSTATCSHGADRQRQRETMQFFHPEDIMEKFYFDWPPSNSCKCQEGRSSGPVKTLNVRADFLSKYGPYSDTTAIRCDPQTYFLRLVNTVLISNDC